MNGIPLGFTPSGKRIIYSQKTSLVTFGGAGSGKTNQLIEAALEWSGSLVVLDVAGEIAAVTAHARRRFGKVYQINPYGLFREELSGIPCIRYNPMYWLDPKDTEKFGPRAAKIAEGCVRQPSDRDLYWYTSARQLVKTVIECEAGYGKR